MIKHDSSTDDTLVSVVRCPSSVVGRPSSVVRRHHLALTGFSTTGKSTVARLLADALGWYTVDTDQLIVAAAGKTVQAIFAEQGERAFRLLEAAVLTAALAGEGKVIATGGGVVVSDANRALLRERAWTVCLTARPETILARLERAAPSEPRPLLAAPNPLDRIRRLLEQRQAAYAEADLIVATDERTPSEVMTAILEWLPQNRVPFFPLQRGEGHR